MIRRRGRPLDGANPDVEASVNPEGSAPPDAVPPAFERQGPLLGEWLVAEGLVAPDDLATALAEQEGGAERPIGEILVRRGVVDARAVSRAVAAQYGLPVVDLRTIRPDPDALAALPSEVARPERVLPLRHEEHGEQTHLVVAVDRVPTQALLDRMAGLAAGPVDFVLAPEADLTRALDSNYRAIADVDQFVAAFEKGEAARGPAGPGTAVTVDEHAPVVQVVTRILTQAVRERASDIHIEPQDGRVRVRFRVDGALHEPLHLPASMAQALVSRLKIMAEMNIVERRRAQDGQFEFTADGRTLDVRVATMATIWGEKAVLRLLDRSRSLLAVEQLGMPERTAEEFSRMIRSPFGMVICAGPTGSGKTTTLYAALNEIADPERNITTIEDPVEYVFAEVNQIQINEAADITFAGGLKAILRQDPDIILVGEMRDVETARIAIQSALTGHLVLSSLHATDAASALQRFLDMGIESFLVASSVVAVVGQRLVRRICGSCVGEYEPSAEERAFYEDSGGVTKAAFVRGHGCNFCAQTGYAERIGVFELLRVTNEIKQLVLDNAPHAKIQATAVEQGMRTLREEGIRLVEHDVTTIGEVMRRIYSV